VERGGRGKLVIYPTRCWIDIRRQLHG